MIHEWEDAFSEALHIPHVSCDQMDFGNQKYGQSNLHLIFIPVAGQIKEYLSYPQLIPVVMDLWAHDIPEFIPYIIKFKFFFVTSLEAFLALKSIGIQHVAYLPYSVPDIYVTNSVPHKDLDIIQFGRTNPLLDSYMKIFLNKFPETNYVTTRHHNNSIYFHSTRDGMLFESNSRQRFMDMLSRSTISLVSTAGMDGSRETGGYNTVSPRFYESIAGCCRLIGRFPHSEEFAALGVDAIAERVDSYEEFEWLLLKYIGKPFDQFGQYLEYLSKNTTSQRVPLIVNALDKLHGLRANLLSAVRCDTVRTDELLFCQ
ncbi:MAG: hypothetical protein ACOYL3_02630 [Desulfuromonadaceae bacterium]